MKELYLEVFSNVAENGVCFVPLETLITLFIYEYCEQPPLLVTLVLTTDVEGRARFKIKLPKYLFEIVCEEDVERPGNLCKLPLIVADDGAACAAGLCAVLRQVLKAVDPKHSLLGFKQNCLYGCAESSLWTRFCEVDFVKSSNRVFLNADPSNEVIRVPRDVARFEVHMGKPVKTHNVEKEKQEAARRKGLRSKASGPAADGRPDLVPDLEHAYVEGHKMSLADLILLPCFHVVLRFIGSRSLRHHLPLTYKWYDNLMKRESVARAIKFVRETDDKVETEKYVEYLVPEVTTGDNLYKKKGRGGRGGTRHSYTKQELIDESLELASDPAGDLEWDETAFGREIQFAWTTTPFDIQLDGNNFPAKRLERKAQQLENVAKAVLKVAKDGDCIVDFCSGSGYLGLVLAHSLPRCTVVLLENKEESLRRARERAKAFKLSNLIFCQGNIDYFRGDFDVGVSLHACGVATDLVMEKCIGRRASFVCCPCCYGSIRPNHVIDYPRSKRYRESSLTLEHYLTLAHSSDQTHGDACRKTGQGKKCMAVIDIDRCLRAKEEGYFVSASTMEPPSCTPKNNLLVGIYGNKSNP